MTKGALKLADVERTIEREADIASWQSDLRMAIYDAIDQEDVTEIVRNQVEKAKKGDPNAIKFVFGHVLGANRSLTVNNTQVITDVETAAKIAKPKGAG
jgi:hypothetical protein